MALTARRMSATSESFAPLHAKVEATRAVLADSIAVALDNSARLEAIETQSAELEATADRFRRETVDLRRKMFWKNVQMKVAIGTGIALALGAVGGILYALSTQT